MTASAGQAVSAPPPDQSPSTITDKIVGHSFASPQSNPNISRFAQAADFFWADSDGDLPAPVCGAFLDNNKKTEAGMPQRCVSKGEHHHGDDGVPPVQGIEIVRFRSSCITSGRRVLYPCARRAARS